MCRFWGLVSRSESAVRPRGSKLYGNWTFIASSHGGNADLTGDRRQQRGARGGADSRAAEDDEGLAHRRDTYRADHILRGDTGTVSCRRRRQSAARDHVRRGERDGGHAGDGEARIDERGLSLARVRAKYRGTLMQNKSWHNFLLSND